MLRKSPRLNEETTLVVSESSVRWTAPGTNVEQDWRWLERVVRRPRGFLLYFRGGGASWWPDHALSDGTVAEVEAILRDKTSFFVSK